MSCAAVAHFTSEVESLRLWCQKLMAKGWAAEYERTPGEEAHEGFAIMLSSPWQQQLLGQFGNMVCLDSMHKTCRGPSDEKIFLTTVLTRDRVTGRGVPLAWLLTNHESQ
ncbi:hypothetical protein K439DRAFT_1359286 [Ramaria rubella]|nr:hypothetical protein K439DRAFT_1359286 [Ramaria rubella]